MLQVTLPRNSRIKTGKTWNRPESKGKWKEFRVYRWNPDNGGNPRARIGIGAPRGSRLLVIVVHPTSYSASRDACKKSGRRIGSEPALRDEGPNFTVTATGLRLCRRPRPARRSESSSNVAPFAKMNESARSSNTAVTRLCPKQCSRILCKAPSRLMTKQDLLPL
jgi:hypothetical protein